MALLDTDVFIVSDTTGANYKIAASDLKAYINAGASGGGGGMGNVFHGYSNNSGIIHNLGVPAGNQFVMAASKTDGQSKNGRSYVGTPNPPGSRAIAPHTIDENTFMMNGGNDLVIEIMFP